MKIKVLMALALLVVCTSVARAGAEEEMPPDQKAMMEAMMKAMTPGDAHKLLDNMVGTFDAKVTSWMAPGAPPMDRHRHLGEQLDPRRPLRRAEVHRQLHGHAVQRHRLHRLRQRQEAVLRHVDGQHVDRRDEVDRHGRRQRQDVEVQRPRCADPMTGKDAPMEEKVTVTDKDHHTMEMWTPGPDGKMFKMMEIDVHAASKTRDRITEGAGLAGNRHPIRRAKRSQQRYSLDFPTSSLESARTRALRVAEDREPADVRDVHRP